MTAPDLLREARKRGLHLEPRGDGLFVAPKDRLAPDFANLLRAHKAELLSWLSHTPRGWQTVPPSDLPLNPAMPRPSPEDRERMILYLRRQTGDRACHLSEWIVLRENAYYTGIGNNWDDGIICYAACRDAACWQLGRREAEALQLIAGCVAGAEHFQAGRILDERGNDR